MQPIITRIKERGTPPTRQDVADVLASIGVPGENQAEKVAAVKQLFDETGHRNINFQGHSVYDDLGEYEAY